MFKELTLKHFPSSELKMNETAEILNTMNDKSHLENGGIKDAHQMI